MFLNFFNELREAKVPVTLKEYLSLMEAMDKGVIDRDVEDFYYLARAALVKDERNIDKFDKVFGHVFKGLDSLGDAVDELKVSSRNVTPTPAVPPTSLSVVGVHSLAFIISANNARRTQMIFPSSRRPETD